MKIGILGTGVVGREHAKKLSSLGHTVMIGTNDVAGTLAQKKPDEMGNAPFKLWQKENPTVELGDFGQVAEFGEIVFNALKGAIALDVLKKIPNESLREKILVDISNPLDFSKGMPPTLLFCSTDSLGEQIQKHLPNVHVVKAFNTVNAYLQTHPKEVVKGNHTVFLCGNNKEAKAVIVKLMKKYGWKDIIDLGDIKSARGMEMLLPLWLEIWSTVGTAKFNFKIVK